MLLNATISELTKGLRDKKYSITDLVSESYNAIERYEDRINALITVVDKQKALARAKTLEKKLSQTSSPLYGLPFVMKDAYITRDVETTAASNVLDGYVPAYSATVYQRLLDAGAILVGKANMDAWGHGASTENTDYGTTKNPWALNRSAGGSGGGPAAAISARYCAFAIGEDTGGSIRNPAAWNNISAMKVTYGRVSRYGAIAYASSLDTMGPTAKSVEDCAHVLEGIAGRDPYDATSSPYPVPSYTKELTDSVRGMKIAFPTEFYGEALDKEIRQALYRAKDAFSDMGVTVDAVSSPLLEYGVPVYYILAPSETSSNLSRYDGIRYGGSRDLFTRETMRRIMTGTYALSSGYYDAFYKKALEVRTLLIDEYSKLLSEYDAILSPVTPMMPTRFGELISDPMKNMLADLYTVIVNIVGLPSLSMPAGFNKDGLPIGMQLIGSMFSESTLFRLGYAYQKETDWHWKTPKLIT